MDGGSSSHARVCSTVLEHMDEGYQLKDISTVKGVLLAPTPRPNSATLRSELPRYTFNSARRGARHGKIS